MFDQRLDLMPELVERSPVVDDDVGSGEASVTIDLSCDPGASVLLGEPALFDESAYRGVRIDVDHHEEIQVVASRFHQQRDVENHRLVRCRCRVDTPLNFTTDGGVHDGIEARESIRIVEHPVRECLPVKLAGREEDDVAEFGDDRIEDRLSRLLQFTGDRVGVDDGEPVCEEQAGNRRLSTPDTAGEADQVHTCSRYLFSSSTETVENLLGGQEQT